MSLQEIYKNSIVIYLLTSLCRRYICIEERLIYVYDNSKTCKLINGSWVNIALCCRYSFLGRLTEIRESANAAVLNNSWSVRHLMTTFRRWKEKIICYMDTSQAVRLIDETKREFYFSPLKTASVIVIIAIITNAILSIILGKEISLWGWVMRGLFLVVVIAGFFCSADWNSIINNSIIFRRFIKTN